MNSTSSSQGDGAERPPTPLERTLGWTFKDESLCRMALTHSTYANEHPEEGPDYERLEFLGDAVLDLIAARILFQQLQNAREGELSRRRSRVVRRETLAMLARKLDLSAHLRLGEGQQRSGTGLNERILADVYEALAGAVYLDGGYEAAEACFAAHIEEAIVHTTDILDFKTRLQELCHCLAMASPQYQVVEVVGPAHARQYTCEVVIGEDAYGRGTATSKKAAEQQCARQATELLEKRLEAQQAEPSARTPLSSHAQPSPPNGQRLLSE